MPDRASRSTPSEAWPELEAELMGEFCITNLCSNAAAPKVGRGYYDLLT